MFLLDAVEEYLGSIDSWPSPIIFDLFAENPKSAVIERLTSFFAGNEVPQTLAYRLYSACNPLAADDLVRRLFSTSFSLWRSSDVVRRHSMYYDVRIKKLVRRDVPYLPSLLDLREKAVPVPGLQETKLGVHNTATPTVINAALQSVRQVPL